MRELHECQAEVFRRSEKRIKERKQRRKRILMVCIPLVLCIPLCAAFFLKGPNRTAPGAPVGTNFPMNSSTGNWDGDFPASILRVEVYGLDFSRIYTDAADIILISGQLNSYDQPVYEEPTESVADGEYKESADTNDHHSSTTVSGSGGELKEEATGENYNGSSVKDDLYGATSDSASTDYTITLTTDTGTQMEYYLSGNILLNRVTNQSRKLTQAEANTLKELLGIPNP